MFDFGDVKPEFCSFVEFVPFLAFFLFDCAGLKGNFFFSLWKAALIGVKDATFLLFCFTPICELNSRRRRGCGNCFLISLEFCFSGL